MQKELLSAYIDGEQVSNELTEELCRDADLQESWAHFHTIRSVMRNETDVLLGADFSAKMEALIEQEEIRIAQPVVSQPTADEVEKSPFAQKLKAWFAPMMQVAVAAGVCLIAVTSFQSFTTANNAKEIPDTPVLQTLPFNNSVQEVSYNAPARDVVTPEQVEQKSKRIGAMLQNYELQRRVYADGLSMQRTEK